MLSLRQHSLEDKTDLTDSFEDVSILFTDISGFTKYCDSHKEEECV